MEIFFKNKELEGAAKIGFFKGCFILLSALEPLRKGFKS